MNLHEILRAYGIALLAHEANPMPPGGYRWFGTEYIGSPEAVRMQKRRAVSGKALRKAERKLQAAARELVK